jgi:diguanylate cyclase (GGDEF)-like protein
MQMLLERFIISSTPAWRVLLAVFCSTPFYVITLLALCLALWVPEVRQGLDVPVVVAAVALLVLATVLSVGMAWWLWPRRDQVDPRPGFTWLVCLVIGLTYGAVAMLAGTYTSGMDVVLLGVLAVGLLLFDRRPVLGAYLIVVGMLAVHDLGVGLGWWAYAPALNVHAFLGREPSSWLAGAREFVLLCGNAVLLGLVFVFFERLDAMHNKLKRLSYTDGLTGLANRRRFMEVLHNEVARQGRTGQALSLVLIDADHFKDVNDRFGHGEGDQVLRTLGRLMMACVRTPTDLACRLGGEEFALILPDTRLEQVEQVCERLREQLAQQRFGEGDKRFRVTVSMGVVECVGLELEEVLRRADQELYRAKASGRDRVCISQFDPEVA